MWKPIDHGDIDYDQDVTKKCTHREIVFSVESLGLLGLCCVCSGVHWHIL